MQNDHGHKGRGAAPGAWDVPAWVEAALPRGFGVEDLLSFVEGELDDERSAQFLERLSAKTELERWVLSMRADRDGVRALGPDGEASLREPDALAHGGLVAAAMGALEPATAGSLTFDLTAREALEEDLVEFEFDQMLDQVEPVAALPMDRGSGGRALAPEPSVGPRLSSRTIWFWLSGVVAGAAMVAFGVGLGVWMAGALTDREAGPTVAMAPQEAPTGSPVVGGREPVRTETSFGRSVGPSTAEQSPATGESDQRASISSFADSIVDGLADGGAEGSSSSPGASVDTEQREEPVFEERVPSDLPDSTPVITRRDVLGDSGGEPRERRRALLASEAKDLAREGRLEIEIVRSRFDRRSFGIERHAALTAGGVTIASLRGEDPDQAVARDAALARLGNEGRMPRSEPFVFLVELEPTTRRLDRLKVQLEEQTGGEVRFVEAERVLEPSIEARLWLWTGGRVDLRGMARFPLFVVIED